MRHPQPYTCRPRIRSDLKQCMCGHRWAAVGANSLSGKEYLASLSYASDHIRRNFGILWAWWVLFASLKIASGGSLLVPRENLKATTTVISADEESQIELSDNKGSAILSTSETEVDGGADLGRNESVFTWKNLTYTVKTPSGDRILLDNVQGWIKPGMLGALMGSSGAGKTTVSALLFETLFVFVYFNS